MGQAFLPTLAIVWIHTGIALGARWSEISTGLPPSAVQADAAGNVYFADSLNKVIRVLRPINDPF
jgi:hypothetical protein